MFLINKSLESLTNQPTDDSHATTNYYVDSFSKEGRSRCEFSFAKNDRENDFDKTLLTSLHNSTPNRNTSFAEEVVDKNYVGETLSENTILRKHWKDI